MNYSEPDLTLHPPRSPRSRLGGLCILPRMIDKCRSTIAGKNGEYHYDCPLDQRLLSFLGVSAEAFKAEAATGKGDGELLAWLHEHSSTKPSEWEIAQWSEWQSNRAPADTESREFFNGYHQKYGAKREDIENWFDLLDLDDYVTFHGKA